VGARNLKRFLNTCEHVKLSFRGHRYTWFRFYFMSRIDRCFAQLDVMLAFSYYTLLGLDKSILDYFPFIYGRELKDLGWRPF
jgi:hypothetical protein